MFPYWPICDEWRKSDVSVSPPRAIEIPMNNFHAVEVLYPLGVVDKLRDSSVHGRRHLELSYQFHEMGLIAPDVHDDVSIWHPLGDHTECRVAPATDTDESQDVRVI